jgi:hypothetical protein
MADTNQKLTWTTLLSIVLAVIALFCLRSLSGLTSVHLKDIQTDAVSFRVESDGDATPLVNETFQGAANILAIGFRVRYVQSNEGAGEVHNVDPGDGPVMFQKTGALYLKDMIAGAGTQVAIAIDERSISLRCIPAADGACTVRIGAGAGLRL